MKLAIHPETRSQLDNLIASPSHAIMLTGPQGTGKSALAKQLAQELLATKSFEDYAYGLRIEPIEDKAIGIDAVRQIEHFLSRRVPSKQSINRLVLIENGHKLTIEAQNALLKMLEEPPSGTVFVITATSEKLLLPTIRSRTPVINVKLPPIASLEKHFSQLGYKEPDIKQAYTISGGLPGLMHALLSSEDHPLKLAIEKSRSLLSQSPYERLQTVDELSKQRGLFQDILFILQQMARLRLLETSGQAASRWQRILSSSYQAEEELRLNGQPKLVLTKLMLTL